jgi:hypothetical protein
MQAELDAIAVVPNVEERLDRLFNRIGIRYGGDFRTYFEQLQTEQPDPSPEPELSEVTDLAALYSDQPES